MPHARSADPVLAAPVRQAAQIFHPRASPAERPPIDGARLFQNFCLYTPILWGLGTLTLCAALMVLRLAWARWPRGVAINTVVCGWLLIAVVQAITSTIHGLSVGHFMAELPNVGSFAVIGWGFGALIIAMGSAHRLASPRTVRMVAWLGLYMLVLSCFAVPLRMAGITPPGLQVTPLGLLLPATNTARFYTSAVLFMPESTFGENTARLILFFPWYTALGLGAVSVVLISTLEKNRMWRFTSMLGGTIATIFSWSRIAIFCLIAVGAFLAFMRLPRGPRVALACTAAVGLFAAMVAGFDPLHAYNSTQSAVDAARSGSNMARELIYSKSWEGFLESPYFGNGLLFPPALRTEPIAIGSHSTIYGLLYTAGAPGLAAFILAMAVTFIALCRRYLTLPRDSIDRQVVLIAIGLVICLALYCKFEAIYSLTLPCIVLFAWIGAALPSPLVEAALSRAQIPGISPTASAGRQVLVPEIATAGAFTTRAQSPYVRAFSTKRQPK